MFGVSHWLFHGRVVSSGERIYLQNLRLRIFLNFNPCANFQTLWYRYSLYHAACAHCSLFGVILHLSGFYVMTVVIGRCDSRVCDYSLGDTRQQANQLQWLHTAWSECWLLMPIDSLDIASIWSCGGPGMASDHWAMCPLRRVAVRHCIQHYQQPTTSSLTSRGLATLHVQLLSGIHSAQTWMFISWLLYMWHMRLVSVDRARPQKD